MLKFDNIKEVTSICFSHLWLSAWIHCQNMLETCIWIWKQSQFCKVLKVAHSAEKNKMRLIQPVKLEYKLFDIPFYVMNQHSLFLISLFLWVWPKVHFKVEWWAVMNRNRIFPKLSFALLFQAWHFTCDMLHDKFYISNHLKCYMLQVPRVPDRVPSELLQYVPSVPDKLYPALHSTWWEQEL